MTYNITTPNATKSPGVFPAQANTNFQRIQDIINGDHLFVPASAATQGIHKQATFLNRATPGSITAGNGVLYSANDNNARSQLYWYNGITNSQVSGNATINVTSSLTLNASATSSTFYTLNVNCQGTLFVNSTDAATERYTYYLFYRSSSDNYLIPLSSNSVFAPTAILDGGNIKIKNNSAGTRTFQVILSVVNQ